MALEKSLRIQTAFSPLFQKVPISSLSGEQRVVGLYFASGSCNKCQKFTPRLSEVYKKVKGRGFEIIYVPNDKSLEDYRHHRESMPWLALEQDNPNIEYIRKQFKAKGTPHLVLLSGGTGEVINSNALKDVDSDSNGQNYPWTKAKSSSCVLF